MQVLDREGVARLMRQHLRDLPKPARDAIRDLVEEFAASTSNATPVDQERFDKDGTVAFWIQRRWGWWVRLRRRGRRVTYVYEFMQGDLGYRLEKFTRKGWTVIAEQIKSASGTGSGP